MSRRIFLFKLTRKAVIIFWVIIAVALVALYFLVPTFYTHFNYQKTPFVNTPGG